MVIVIINHTHHHALENPADDFELQSAEAARSGGDLVFSVPLKGCEVIICFYIITIASAPIAIIALYSQSLSRVVR